MNVNKQSNLTREATEPDKVKDTSPSPQVNMPDGIEGHCLDCKHGEDGQCGSCHTCPRASHEPPRGKLYATNWLDGISDASDYELVEVQFKNTRKGFYKNSEGLDIHMGDMVAVEASPGHDIGEVTMVGRLVQLHIKKANLKPDYEFKRIFRLAKPADLERFKEAKAKEQDAMIRSRKIAEELGLDMKIGDVEYQGDGAKAIFYYLADERVDFRKLIRVLADTFKVRIEMKQIGARQEAGRIGGIGPCGRPLCCSSWMTGFVSVGTSAARFQDLSMNPQKLAGQCAKLKCCLNFEVDAYMEASRKLPSKDIPLETQDSTYYHFKSDIMSGMMTYSTDKHAPVNCVTIHADRVSEIIAANKEGLKVESLEAETSVPKKTEFVELVGQDNINRFDKSKKKKKKSSPQSDKRKKDSNPGQQEKKAAKESAIDPGKQTQRADKKVDKKQQPRRDRKPDRQRKPRPNKEPRK
ncbi:MAG: hypothetical protein NC217_03060 [Muribaculaceae bacterium]|nr:hypothetical protein [Muribaculaceae bacterium]